MKMPRRFRPEWIVLIVALIVIAVFTALSAGGSSASYPALSASSNKPNGALAAYEWLGSLHYDVHRVSSLDLSYRNERRTTIFLLQQQPFQVSLPAGGQVLAWVQRGGTAVVAARPSMRAIYAQAQARMYSTASPVRRVVEPILTRPPTSHLDGTAFENIVPFAGVTVAVTSKNHPALVRMQMGKGVLWLLSAPDAVDNAHLGHAGNSSLLLSLAGRRGRTVDFVALPAPPIPTKTTSVFQLPWGIAILFGIAVFLVFRWLTGWRLGPPIPEPEYNTRPSTDYVLAVAGLLRKARRRSDVLQMYVDETQGRSEHPTDKSDATAEGRPARDKMSDVELIRRARELAEQTDAAQRH